WLGREEPLGVGRDGAGKAGALLHPAADLGREVVFEPAEPHERQLQLGNLADLDGPEVGELAEREPDVLGERQGTPERAPLEQDTEGAPQDIALVRRGGGEVGGAVPDRAAGGLVQADHVSKEGALPAAAPAHDEEDVAAVDREVEVAHHDVIPEGHRQALHRDVRIAPGCHQIPRTFVRTAKMPSVTMIQTMPSTTAEVAASPTAAASRPQVMPRRQPASATSTPNTTLFPIPSPKSTSPIAPPVSTQYCAGLRP